MKIGAILHCGPDIGEFRDQVRLAEDLGYHTIGNGDHPTHYRDLYVALAISASITSRAAIGPIVTDPIIRHPAATASAIASIDALSKGRAFLGFASGGGGLEPLGLSPATNAQIRGAVVGIRELLTGAPSNWAEGRPLSCPPAHRVPIFLAAYGFSRARLAGEVADGLIWAGGVSDDILGKALDAVAEGARATGRDPSAIEIWAMLRAGVGDTTTEAVAGIKANLAAAGIRGLGAKGIFETVPVGLRDKVRELMQRFVVADHVRWDGANAALVDALGLTDFLADRFAIAGSPEAIRAKVKKLAKRGIAQLIVPAVDKEPHKFLPAFASAVGLG